MSKPTVIAIVNQKGGTGKTCTAENLGVGLAASGRKVLLVDFDPQGSLTISLGYPRPDELSPTISDVLAGILREQSIPSGLGILRNSEGVELMPANIELSGLEVSLVNAMSRETILRQYLDTVKRNYDVVLIDCSPSLGMLTVNALAAADSVIIPVQAQYLSAKGLEQLLGTINRVKRQINPKLRIEGVLLTMVDSRTNYANHHERNQKAGAGQCHPQGRHTAEVLSPVLHAPADAGNHHQAAGTVAETTSARYGALKTPFIFSKPCVQITGALFLYPF